jgi:hypothetical protein
MSEVPGVYRVGNVLMVSFPRRPTKTFSPAPLYLPRMVISQLTRSLLSDKCWPVAPFVTCSPCSSGD